MTFIDSKRPTPRYLVAGIAVVALLGSALHFSANSSVARSGDLIRPFAANSPFNVPIPANPAIDPRSLAYVSKLTSGNMVANTTDYANAVYDNVDASTPRFQVHITNDNRNGGNWGHNDMYGMSIPVPTNAVPPAGTDGTVVIVDRAAAKTYYLWQFRRDGNRIISTWPSVFNLNGLGITDNVLGGRGTAAGVSQLAGTIRVEEMRAGVIDHALAFATGHDLGCGAPGPGGTQNPNGEFRWPAVGTDGHIDKASDPNCLPYGIRVQLDPSLNLDDTTRFPNLTRGDRMIGKAMQKYGAYLIDKSGASMALSFELTEPGEPSYCQLGLAAMGSWACPTADSAANYYSFKSLLQNNIRVLADCQCGTTKGSVPTGAVTPAPSTTKAPSVTSVVPTVPSGAGTVTAVGNLLAGAAMSASVPSAVGDFSASRSNDANSSSRWISTPVDNVTLSSDLKSVQTLGKVSILWAGDTTKAYDVQMSHDNQTWKTVASGTTDGRTQQLVEHRSFTASPTGRYLRILAKNRWNSAYGHSIFEIGAYRATATDLLSGAKLFGSVAHATGDFAPARANDRNDQTRWISAPTDNVALTADLGGVRTVRQVNILWAGDTTKSYELQMSADNATWRTIGTGVTNNKSRQLLIHSRFSSPPSGRYLRVVGKDRWNQSYGHSIWEINAYGS